MAKVEPPVSRLTSFPETVTPAAPGVMRTPSTTAAEVDPTVTSKPSMITSDGNVGWGMPLNSAIVLDPTIKVPEGWTLMTVPWTVTAGPPAEMVVPAIVRAEESGLSVNVWPASVYVLPRGRRLVVELPIAKAPDGPRLMTVPPIVRAGPPADMVVPAIENEEGSGVKV